MRIFLFLVVLLGASSARGQIRYDFVSDGTSLATIEFGRLPGDHADVTQFVFSPEGNSIFGLGTIYSGTFDRIGEDLGGFDAQSDGGLQGQNFDFSNNVVMYDDDPPPSSLPGIFATRRMDVTASQIVNIPSETIRLHFVDVGGASHTISRDGFWMSSVPEPNCGGLIASLAVSALVSRFWMNKRRPSDERRRATEAGKLGGLRRFSEPRRAHATRSRRSSRQ
jgi:hypothetical protein